MALDLLGGLGIFKTLYDSAKALKDINDATVRNAAVIDLQEKILAARDAQSALVARVGALEKELAGFETWETEKKRYKLEQLPPGVHVYSLKPEMAAGEPAHHICQTCYQRGKKSVLQSDEPGSGIYHLTCNECGTVLQIGHWQPPRVDYDHEGRPNSWMGV